MTTLMTPWMPRTTSHHLTSGAPADVPGWQCVQLAALQCQLALAAAAAAAAPEWAKWYGVWLSLLYPPFFSPSFSQAPPYGQGQHPPAGACPLLCVCRLCGAAREAEQPSLGSGPKRWASYPSRSTAVVPVLAAVGLLA